MENTYWNRKGKYQEQYNQMMDDLVPVSGNMNSVQTARQRGYPPSISITWSGPE